MIGSILKILAGLVDFPKYFDRIKGFFLKKKVEKLEVAIEDSRATMAVERVQEAAAKKTEETRKLIKNETQDDTLDDIAKYFGAE